MIKRQQRLNRITAVTQEYLAASTAASLLRAELDADPSYCMNLGWKAKAGLAFSSNLDATYLIRILRRVRGRPTRLLEDLFGP